MQTRKLIDISTAHLSPAARAWLSECATANHAAAFHGFGDGARIGIIGATLYGWFMRLPSEEEAADTPEDMAHLFYAAARADCNYILFDADGDIIDGLPLYEEGD